MDCSSHHFRKSCNYFNRKNNLSLTTLKKDKNKTISKIDFKYLFNNLSISNYKKEPNKSFNITNNKIFVKQFKKDIKHDIKNYSNYDYISNAKSKKNLKNKSNMYKLTSFYNINVRNKVKFNLKEFEENETCAKNINKLPKNFQVINIWGAKYKSKITKKPIINSYLNNFIL